ncbi:ATPase [Treponema sp.]|uniref:V-type ATP synthase subunit I n=1 Tax=Treponema sp. TaxID=166 RepID=UPI00298E1CFE|nr:ATPase [Treponema sp.]MCQ2242026.1 ATPase [Treponema sp.]
MIVEMKKVSLVILEAEKTESLKALRKAGVLHLEEIEGGSAELSAYKEQSSETEKALAILEEVKLGKKQTVEQVKLSAEDAVAKAKEIISFTDTKKSLFDKINQNTQELARLEKWGSVNPAELASLTEKGLYLYMFEIPQDKYSEISKDINTVVVNKINKVVRFLLVSDVEVEERPEGLPAEAYSVPLPECSTEKLKDDIVKAKAEIERLDREIVAAKKFEAALKESKNRLLSDIEFENISSGMEKEDEELSEAETRLAWVTGYVPVDSMDNFKKVCSDNSWAYVASEPKEDDMVPTKLKNNKLVSLIYPLTDFLGTVPGYHEYDISGWFLLFFTVFFGMIFGDGGYGLLLTGVGVAMAVKSLASKKGGSLAGLVLLLGLATVAWGTVTCTWFGLTPDMLPDWLKELSVPQLSNAYGDTQWPIFWKPESGLYLTTAQNLQIFCFTLALLQLSVAHLKGIAANLKSLKWIGEFGSLMQVVGMYWVVLSMVVSAEVFTFNEVIYGIPVGKLAIGLVAVGFVLSFVFSSYSGSVVESVLESCKNIISVLLGVVNVFSDVVSYIRLWAVGLAGAAISGTVNSMAGPLLGHAVLFVGFLALIVFGHGLNMILNLLSVIVHGVRLNTLEFSNHLGMSWSGFKYNPFSERD